MLPTRRQSIATLANGIVDDARRLARLEVRLAITLWREELRRNGRAALLVGTALLFLLPAVLLLCLALSSGLAALTGLPVWACQAVTALPFAGWALVCLRRARRLAKGEEA